MKRPPVYSPACVKLVLLALLFPLFSCGSLRQSAEDNSALYEAIHAGDAARVRALLGEGADPNSTYIKSGFNERYVPRGSKAPPRPLVLAISRNQPEIVKLLLEKGAKFDFKDDVGYTPLEHGVSGGNPEIVKALLERGADAGAESKFGFPLIFRAACSGNEEAVRLLLEKGADANARDSAGLAGQHHVGSLESTYERMLGRSAPRTRPGATLLMLAAQTGHAGVVKVLIDRGAELNAKDGAGRTALMIVAEEGVSPTVGKHAEVARLLLAKGADVRARDNNGDTALARARKFAGMSPFHDELARLLQEAGAEE